MRDDEKDKHSENNHQNKSLCLGYLPQADEICDCGHPVSLWISAMTGLPVVHNKRKAKCAGCKGILKKGEGIGVPYPMFHGNGQYFYMHPDCKAKRDACLLQDSINHEKELQESRERLKNGK